MALPFYNWSRTAASNATADSTVNWSEGQAPSSVNDSGRAMMASTAAFRDDISGAITTGGSATAYTVTSYQVFDTLAHLSGQMIAFTPHATNTGSSGCTLNVDSLGAKAIRSSPNVELPSGSLILGTPYVATYNNSDSCFYLQGGAANAYSIPLGGFLDYAGSTAPNSAFVLPIGQAISRTTYATLFSLISTTYGVGDGSTTFNVPDLTGRVTAMKESTATRLTTAGSGVDGGTLGAAGGAQNITMARANLPQTSVSVTITDPGHNHTIGNTLAFVGSENIQGGTGANISSTAQTIASHTTGITAAFNLNGNVTQTAMIVAQPTIVLNKIMRII